MIRTAGSSIPVILPYFQKSPVFGNTIRYTAAIQALPRAGRRDQICLIRFGISQEKAFGSDIQLSAAVYGRYFFLLTGLQIITHQSRRRGRDIPVYKAAEQCRAMQSCLTVYPVINLIPDTYEVSAVVFHLPFCKCFRKETILFRCSHRSRRFRRLLFTTGSSCCFRFGRLYLFCLLCHRIRSPSAAAFLRLTAGT